MASPTPAVDKGSEPIAKVDCCPVPAGEVALEVALSRIAGPNINPGGKTAVGPFRPFINGLPLA